MSVVSTNTGLRVSMFFEDGITGWSETHYDTVRTTLQGAITTAVNTLVPARVNLLANGPWLKYIRASRDGTFRDAQIAYLPPPPMQHGTGIYINNQQWSNQQAAVDWTTALLRGVGGDFYRRQVYISGVPYNDPTDIGAPQFDAVLVQAAQQYANVLQQNGYGFAVWARDPAAPGLAPVPVQNITVNAGGVTLFTTVAPHGLPATPLSNGTFYRVFFHGLSFTIAPGNPKRIFPSPNGGFPYVVQSPTTFTVPGYLYPGSPNNTASYIYNPLSGYMQAQYRAITTYQQTGGVVLERFTHRKRGRPFDSPRGRSSRRQILAV